MMELKPCPFCGGAAELREDGYEVHCANGCTARVSDDYRDEAIAAWNTRSPDPRIAKLEAQLATKGPYMPVDPTVMVTGPGQVSDRTVYSVGEALAEKGEGMMGGKLAVHDPETQERKVRRLFDELARNIGREAVNHLKTMYSDTIGERMLASKSWETSLVNTIRNDINWRMRPLLMAMIAMHNEWDEEISVSTKDEAP